MVKKTSVDRVYQRKDAAYWRMVHATAITRLGALRVERDEREAELEQLGREILQMEKVVASLQPLTSDITVDTSTAVEGIEGMGLADACREVLKQQAQYRTARGVRDSLAASGYDLSQHPNPLASIHGVLKRFVESGEVEELESDGKARYRWKGSHWGKALAQETEKRSKGVKPRSDKDDLVKKVKEAFG